MSHRTIATPFARAAIRAALAFLVALVMGCATTKQSPEDAALAFVNGEPVSVRHLDEAFQSSHQGHTAFLAGAGAVREFLDKTIDQRLLVQEARRIGLDQDPEIRQQVKTLVTQRARDQLYKDEMTRYQEVSAEAVAAMYPKILYRYRVRHILTYTREDGKRAVARIQAGEPFGAVAGEISISGTAGKGGDLGFVTWGQLDPRLEAEIESMRPGEIRGPIETDQGWNVLLLEEKEQREEELPELAKLKSRIKMTLGQRAMSRRPMEYYDQLRAQWKVQIFDQALTEENLLGADKHGPDAEAAKGIIVAKAGERTTSLADLRARLNQEALKQLPWSFAQKQVRDILDEVIFASVLEQEALRRGYAAKPDIANEARKLESALLLDRLLGTVIFPRVQVTDEEVKAFFDQNPKLFTEAEAVRLAAIVLEDEAEAEKVVKEVQSGADFAALARRQSKDPATAQVGGELGWVVKGSLDPAIEAVAYSLRVGAVGLAKNEKASFVLKVLERRPARLQDFMQVKEKASELLLRQRRKEEVQRWVTRLREASEIVIEDSAIAQAVAMYEEQVKQKAAKATKDDTKGNPN